MLYARTRRRIQRSRFDPDVRPMRPGSDSVDSSGCVAGDTFECLECPALPRASDGEGCNLQVDSP
jgi:hypothetical protein